jgi:hypothetical protein
LSATMEAAMRHVGTTTSEVVLSEDERESLER